jgi:hypothetical protein
MKLILQIALGVCLGIMLSAVLSVALWGSFFLKLLPALSTPVSHVTLNSPATTSPTLIRDELIAAGLIEPNSVIQPVIQPEQQPIVAANTTKTAAETEAQQQQLAAQEEKRKKDQAFKNWYHKSLDCMTPNEHGHNIYVACGNEYARAKAKFEELYQQGKL